VGVPRGPGPEGAGGFWGEDGGTAVEVRVLGRWQGSLGRSGGASDGLGVQMRVLGGWQGSLAGVLGGR